ncbi:hypothetical protein FGO68_gene7927 [Halteria grandinella]|uniref:Uncharacterized protein n=1 Tax=Halteria grandinella TaxID=5974 RepID=A0A8J8T4C9_HALGN|nr:hypothetical protein FGO68_gene7927 [Halteria grandinella]
MKDQTVRNSQTSQQPAPSTVQILDMNQMNLYHNLIYHQSKRSQAHSQLGSSKEQATSGNKFPRPFEGSDLLSPMNQQHLYRQENARSGRLRSSSQQQKSAGVNQQQSYERLSSAILSPNKMQDDDSMQNADLKNLEFSSNYGSQNGIKRHVKSTYLLQPGQMPPQSVIHQQQQNLKHLLLSDRSRTSLGSSKSRQSIRQKVLSYNMNHQLSRAGIPTPQAIKMGANLHNPFNPEANLLYLSQNNNKGKGSFTHIKAQTRPRPSSHMKMKSPQVQIIDVYEQAREANGNLQKEMNMYLSACQNRILSPNNPQGIVKNSLNISESRSIYSIMGGSSSASNKRLRDFKIHAQHLAMNNNFLNDQPDKKNEDEFLQLPLPPYLAKRAITAKNSQNSSQIQTKRSLQQSMVEYAQDALITPQDKQTRCLLPQQPVYFESVMQRSTGVCSVIDSEGKRGSQDTNEKNDEGSQSAQQIDRQSSETGALNQQKIQKRIQKIIQATQQAAAPPQPRQSNHFHINLSQSQNQSPRKQASTSTRRPPQSHQLNFIINGATVKNLNINTSNNYQTSQPENAITAFPVQKEMDNSSALQIIMERTKKVLGDNDLKEKGLQQIIELQRKEIQSLRARLSQYEQV